MKFKNCNLYKMQLLDLLPIVRNMIIIVPLLRDYTGNVEERTILKNLL